MNRFNSSNRQNTPTRGKIDEQENMSESNSSNGDGDEHSSKPTGGVGGASSRLLVTNEGNLDPALLIRTEGYMHKKGGTVNARGGFRNWKKRWFVLAPVEFLGVAQGYELQYFDGPNGNLKGKIGLSEVELFCEERSAPRNRKVKYEFQIVLQTGGVLQLSCDSEEEREEWIETLNMVIAFLRKVLTSKSMTLDGYDPQFEDDEESFKIGEDIAQNCQAYGGGLFGSEAGQQAQFVVQMYDLLGQQVTCGGMPITATISSELPEHRCLYYLRIIDNEDGSYFAQYTLGAAGRYTLSVCLNDEHHIFGSPFDIEILPSRTSAPHCIAEGAALEDITLVADPASEHMASPTVAAAATVSVVQSFTIVAMDNFGNKKTRGGDPFEVGIMAAGGTAAAAAAADASSIQNSAAAAAAPASAQLRTLTDMGDGSYICEIEASGSAARVSMSSQQSLVLMVTLHGKHIAGSPFRPTLTTLSGREYANGYILQDQQRQNSAAEAAAGAAAGSSVSNASDSAYQHGFQGTTTTTPTPVAYGDAATTDSSRITPTKGSSSSSSSSAGNSSGRPSRKGPSSSSSGMSSPSKQTSTGSKGTKQSNGDGSSSSPATATSASLHTPTATATATSPAAAAATGPMSRLERSRQRALLAKSLAEGSPETAHSPGGGGSVDAGSATGSAVGGGGAGGGGGALMSGKMKLSQAATRGASNLAALRHRDSMISPGTAASAAAGGGGRNGHLQTTPQESQQHINAIVAMLRQGLGEFSVSSGGAGTMGPPSNATPNECKIWDHTHRAFQSHEEVLKLLCSQLDVLQQLFALFATEVEGVSVIKLVTSTSVNGAQQHQQQHNKQAQGHLGGAGGVYRMLELYDVLPTHLSRVEVKVLFGLALHAQRNLKLPASIAGGGTGLDFCTFLKFLVMLVYHALSKTNSYSTMYNSMEAKVEVMLFKWGLAESTKLQVVRQALMSQN